MKTPRYLTFVNSLDSVLNKFGTNVIKLAIGDSTNNNRVPTVNQVIRFLGRAGTPRAQKFLGKQLLSVYNTASVKSLILDSRGFRTDAIDINELIFAVRNGGLGGVVGRKLAA